MSKRKKETKKETKKSKKEETETLKKKKIEIEEEEENEKEQVVVTRKKKIELEENVVEKNDDEKIVPGADELENLLALDPSNFATKEDFEVGFEKLAYSLMNDFTMEINTKPHRLAELEFYFCGDKHMDVFTHQDPLQQTSGNWYFHRTGKGYKGGSYKGLDITFGQNGFGGILIRAMVDLESDEYIEGPCNCVNHILKLNQTSKTVPEIIEFVEQDGFDLSVSKKGKLYLRKNDSLEKFEVCSGPRVGLTLKKSDGERSYYLMKNYRYMTHPLQVRKGRVNLVLGLHSVGKSQEDIRKITGCTSSIITKYIDLYEEGKTEKLEEYEGKTLSNDDLCKLCGLLNGKNRI